MAIVMRMRWEGVTPDQYDEVRRRVDWVGNVAPGGRVHMASFDSAGVMHCFDVWDSPEDLQNFLESRIMPAVRAIGITSEPTVELDQCHELFIVRAGSLDIPQQDRVLTATPL